MDLHSLLSPCFLPDARTRKECVSLGRSLDLRVPPRPFAQYEIHCEEP